MRRNTRKEILEKLNARVARKEPIIVCEAGVGITAKMAEASGVDMILLDNAAMFRMRGVDDAVAYRPYGDANRMVRSLANRVQSVVDETPVLAGIAMADPNKNMEHFVDALLKLGISGVANLPSVGPLPASYRANIEKNNLGVTREIAFLHACRERDIFTLGQGFYEDDLRAISAGGADVVCINMRFVVEQTTRPALYNDLDACCDYINSLIRAIKSENEENLVAIYGGPFHTVEAIEKCFHDTDTNAYISTCYSDEIPMRKLITKAVREFASFTLGTGQQK